MPKRLEQLDSIELDRLSQLIMDNSDTVADLLFPGRPGGWKSLLDQIEQWAKNRKVALETRAKGSPHIAVVFEKVCYRIWQRLPEDAKRLEVDLDRVRPITR